MNPEINSEIKDKSEIAEIIPDRIETPNSERNSNKINITNLFRARDLSWSSTGFNSGSSRRRSKRQTILFSWLAAGIDFCILLSLSCLFVLSFGLIVKTHFGVILRAVSANPKSLMFFVQVFLFAAWLYMLMLRSWVGASLGEWACDLRLGRPTQRAASSYFWKLLFRQTLIVCTGCVLLPFLSFLIGRDILGVLTGVKLESLD